MEITKYSPITFRAWLELATPNTWGASIMPVLLGLSLAVDREEAFHLFYFVLTLLTAILLHCAVNAFNHGFDGLKGDDSIENCLDPYDAPVVYHHLNPKRVIALGWLYVILALALGIYLTICTGPGLLIIGLIGIAVAFLYAGGPLPLTHLPVGELAAGFTMGGLITLASYFTMTGVLDFSVLLFALPLILVIAMVLLLNNVCDIEKDIPAGRHTLPILIGRQKATALLRGGYSISMLLIAAAGVIFFRAGLWMLIPLIILTFPRLRVLYTMEVTAENRMKGMKAVLPLTLLIGANYVAMILLAALIRHFLGGNL